VEVFGKKNLNEINVVEIFSSGVLNKCLMNLKNSRLKILSGVFLEIIQNKIFEILIGNQFGKNFLRIFKILARDIETEEKKISTQILLTDNTIRRDLFKMFKLGFVTPEEKRLFFPESTRKKTLIWKINFFCLKKRFLSEILKSIFNLLLKLENFKLLLVKISFFRKKKEININNHFKYQTVCILSSISRLDEILLIIYS
jgi:hypothetical protein